jgi:hypothetical protein
MIYAKIDENGNILEFPYRIERIREVPSDAVEVNRNSKRIPTKWYQSLWYDRVEKENDEYVLYYRVGEKLYRSPEHKKECLTLLLKQARENNEKALQSSKITEEVYQNNISIIESVNVNDESTYDNFDGLVYQ